MTVGGWQFGELTMTRKSEDAGREIAVNDATLGEAIDQAFREAFERHREAGVPVVLYENGKTVWRDAAEVLAELDDQSGCKGPRED
jgi:hypothetical protein